MGEECSRQSVDNDHYLEGMLAWGLKREGKGEGRRRVNSQGLFPVVDGTLGKNVLNMEVI